MSAATTLPTRPVLRLGLVAALMSAFLIALLVSHAVARDRGEEIVMAVEGYDPRDILLGHYAELRTAVNTIDLDAVAGDDTFALHAPIHVTLEIGADGLARPVAVHNDHPGDGLVALGRVTATGPMLRARFNIERFYADRAEALALEARLRSGGADTDRVRVILSLTPSGALLIKGFEIDGERRIERLW